MKLGELKALLQARGLAPRHHLGQNFLIDPALLAAIPKDAGVQAGQPVMEVGPGYGALTESLLHAGARVLAVELDRGLASWLRERLAPAMEAGHLQVVEGDVLGDRGRFHPEVEAWWDRNQTPLVVSNLPYGISGPFLSRLPQRSLLGACLLLQREMAERAAAATRGGALSPLAVRLSLRFEVQLGRKVPRQVFWPRPEVESSFLHLRPRQDGLQSAEDQALEPVLRFAFGQRRKRLLPRLRREFPQWAALLESLGVEEEWRPEKISAKLWMQALKGLES